MRVGHGQHEPQARVVELRRNPARERDPQRALRQRRIAYAHHGVVERELPVGIARSLRQRDERVEGRRVGVASDDPHDDLARRRVEGTGLDAKVFEPRARLGERGRIVPRSERREDLRAERTIGLRFAGARIPAEPAGERRGHAARERQKRGFAGRSTLRPRDLRERVQRLLPHALIAFVAEPADEREIGCERCEAVRRERPLIVEQHDPVASPDRRRPDRTRRRPRSR